MTALAQIAVQRLARFALVTQDAARLCRFYEQAMGFCRLAAGRHSQSGTGADSITLVLGREFVELLQFHVPGRPYPDAASASDPCFQHFAIAVADIDKAYRRLCRVAGWRAISTGGPQLLPASSGGVSAFKFRDPDGHPLELLEFPEGRSPARWRARPNRELFLGIDHSAIAVSDSARSSTFYEALGLRLAARSLNSGSRAGESRRCRPSTCRGDGAGASPGHAACRIAMLPIGSASCQSRASRQRRCGDPPDLRG